ncbi:MAG: CoA transferase, partial [Candidatus Adiutricales bacterium]
LYDFYRERMPNAMANTYETKDGKVLRFIAMQADRYWAKFCKILELEDLEHDPRFATIESRAENCKELYYIFKEAFLSKTLAEWMPLISDLPAAPMQNLVDIISDPQAVANDFFLSYDHPSYGPMKIMASPVNLSETPATIRLPAPEFSQHTEEVLMESGYSWEEIEQFKEDEVIP